MATRLATFQQGVHPNTTSDEMYISQSDRYDNVIYFQLIKKGNPRDSDPSRRKNKMMHFSVAPEDIDNIILVLQYAKQEIING